MSQLNSLVSHLALLLPLVHAQDLSASTAAPPTPIQCGGLQSRLCPPETYCSVPDSSCNPYDFNANCTGVCAPITALATASIRLGGPIMNISSTSTSSSSIPVNLPPITYSSTTSPLSSTATASLPTSTGQTCGAALNTFCPSTQICQDSHFYGCDPYTSPMCVGTCEARKPCQVPSGLDPGRECPPRMLCSDDPTGAVHDEDGLHGVCRYREPKCGAPSDPGCPIDYVCVGGDGLVCTDGEADGTTACVGGTCKLTCGARGSDTCPPGGTCVPLPTNTTVATDSSSAAVVPTVTNVAVARTVLAGDAHLIAADNNTTHGVCHRATCGGFLGIDCPSGFLCADKPGDGCNPKRGGTDCIGVCKKVHAVKAPACEGVTGATCTTGQVCVDSAGGYCDGQDCAGTCKAKTSSCGSSGDTPCENDELCIDAQKRECPALSSNSTTSCAGTCTQTCGTLTGIQCASGQECVDIKNGTCGIAADCPGICQKAKVIECGGRDGRLCPKGYKCVDTPNDWCDPAKGEFNCPGTCSLKFAASSTTTAARTGTAVTSSATSFSRNTTCTDETSTTTVTPTITISTTPICSTSTDTIGTVDTVTPSATSPAPTTFQTSAICITTCADYLDECGNAYGGCYDTCTGPAPSFTKPACSLTTPVETTSVTVRPAPSTSG